jgi:two-component system CitB family sensor kinase
VLRLGLRGKVLAIQVGIVLLVAGLVSAAFVGFLSRVVQQQYEARMLAVAQSVAQVPAIREAFDDSDPAATIQPIAESIRQAADLAFVVVYNRDGIRYSHPVPERIGEPVSTDPTPSLEGVPYVATERGTLGLSVRAKVPIYDARGELVGGVSVGVLSDEVQDLLLGYWQQGALVVLAALALGALISHLLASHIKHQLFGLEPLEIAALLQQREALLNGIFEGVLAVDREGNVTVANPPARRLLGLPDDVEGRPIDEVLPDSELPRVAATGQPERDRPTLAHNGRAIVVNRMPVRLRGRIIGAISTFRDQTEVQQLARELSGTRSHLEALRAQAHEFANKLHTIAGFIELGWTDRAVTLIRDTTQEQQRLIDELPRRIGDPALAALLVGKASVAAEQGITLEVPPGADVAPTGELSDDLVTIVGNLIENAFDATEGQPERKVRVEVQDEDGGIRVQVRDSGRGIPVRQRSKLFDLGFTTKAAGDRPRGLGLALVRQSVERWGGRVSVRNDRGAVFDAWLPRPTSDDDPHADR